MSDGTQAMLQGGAERPREPDPATPAAPAPAPSAYQLKKQREAARDAKKERRRDRDRARREARAARDAQAEADAAPPPPSAPVGEPPSPPRTDDQRAHDASVALRGLYRLLGFVLSLVLREWELAPLEPGEADEDAAYVVPLAHQHPALDEALAWLGAPFAFAERFMRHLRRKDARTSVVRDEPANVKDIDGRRVA